MDAADNVEPFARPQIAASSKLYQPSPKLDHSRQSARPALASLTGSAGNTPEPGELPHRSSDESNVSNTPSHDSLFEDRHSIRQTSADSASQASLASPLSSSYCSHASNQFVPGHPGGLQRQSTSENYRLAAANKAWGTVPSTDHAAISKSAHSKQGSGDATQSKHFSQPHAVVEPVSEPNISLKAAEATTSAEYPFPASSTRASGNVLSAKAISKRTGPASGISAIASNGRELSATRMKQQQGMAEATGSSAVASFQPSIDPWQHRDALLGPALDGRSSGPTSSRFVSASAHNVHKSGTPTEDQMTNVSGSLNVAGDSSGLRAGTSSETESMADAVLNRRRAASRGDVNTSISSPPISAPRSIGARTASANQAFSLSPHVDAFNPVGARLTNASIDNNESATAPLRMSGHMSDVGQPKTAGWHLPRQGLATNPRDQLQHAHSSPEIPLQHLHVGSENARAYTQPEHNLHHESHASSARFEAANVQERIVPHYSSEQSRQLSALTPPSDHHAQQPKAPTASYLFNSGYPPELARSLAASLASVPYYTSPYVSGPSSTSEPSTAGLEEITTIFVVGFPEDFEEREFLNMFTFAHGFESATLKIPASTAAAREREAEAAAALAALAASSAAPQNPARPHHPGAMSSRSVTHGLNVFDEKVTVPTHVRNTASQTSEDIHQVTNALAAAGLASRPRTSAQMLQTNRKQIIGFAKFRTREDANTARDILSGRKIDVGRGSVLKAEIAKKNLHIKKSVSDASVISRLYTDSAADHFRPESVPFGNVAIGSGSAPQLLVHGHRVSNVPAVHESSLYTALPSATYGFGPVQPLSQATMQAEPQDRSANTSAWPAYRATEATRLSNVVSPRSDYSQLTHSTSDEASAVLGRTPVGFSQSAFSSANQRERRQPPPSLHSGAYELEDHERLPPMSVNSHNQLGLTPTPAHSASKSLWEQHTPAQAVDSPSPTTLDFRGHRSHHRGDDNDPIATLYVGGLPAILPNLTGPMSASHLEEVLRAVFIRCQGFRRLSFRQKSQGPMCFIEFEDIQTATRALQEMYGHTLGGIVKGGIRLAYSKNPLGVRNNAYTSSPQSPSLLSPSYFASDAQPLPNVRQTVASLGTTHAVRHTQQVYEPSQSTPQQEQFTPVMAYAQHLHSLPAYAADPNARYQ